MGFFDELVGDIVDIAKKETKRAIADSLREKFGQGNANNTFRIERQTRVNLRRRVRPSNDFRISFGQNNDHKHRIEKSRNVEEGGNIVAEDITENSEITQYQNTSKALCIRANDKVLSNRPNYLQNNKKDLLQKYPGFGMEDAVAADFFDAIIKNVFKNNARISWFRK